VFLSGWLTRTCLEIHISKREMTSTSKWILKRIRTFVDYQAEDICVLVQGRMDRCSLAMHVLARGVSFRSFF
jgi:hypothetical protein